MPNIGTIDRIVRLAAGTALVVVSLPLGLESTAWHWIGVLGTLLVVTASYRHCPFYQRLGFSTGHAPQRASNSRA